MLARILRELCSFIIYMQKNLMKCNDTNDMTAKNNLRTKDYKKFKLL